MGWKEELREQGFSERDTSRAVEEAGKLIENEKEPPDFEGIKKTISTEATGTPAELKVVDTASEPWSTMVMKQEKKRPIHYKLPRGGLLIPPIKMKRISPNSYPVVEEGVLSGFPSKHPRR